MQMLFNPSASHPLLKKKNLFSEALFSLHVSLVFFAAVHSNEIWSRHYTFECCRDCTRSRQISICALCGNNWAKGHACNHSINYEMWGLYFRIINCYVERGKSILTCSMNNIFAVLGYWKCPVDVGEPLCRQLSVTIHQFVFSPPTMSAVWFHSSWRSYKLAQYCIPPMLNWPPPVMQAVSGLRSVCSHVPSAV